MKGAAVERDKCGWKGVSVEADDGPGHPTLGAYPEDAW